MAIYHLSIKIISRGKGKSAVAAAAYRAGEKITNEYNGITSDYTKKGGVIHTEILLPEHAPREYFDRSTLWNAVEKSEKAGNAQLAREIEVALPKELSHSQNLFLIREYVKRNFVSHGMCADFAIHDKGDGNPHCHIMLTMRQINGNGKWAVKERKDYLLDENGERVPLIDPTTGKQKVDSRNRKQWKRVYVQSNDWNNRANAEIWREDWSNSVNAFLEQMNVAKIDHRSFARQGKDELPTVHLGVAASQMERKGIMTARGNRNREIAGINKELRQTKARLNKLKKWLAEESQAVAPTLYDVVSSINSRSMEKSRWKRIADVKTAAKILVFLQNNGITELPQLQEKITEMRGRFNIIRENLKKADRRLGTLDKHIKQAGIYFKYKGKSRTESEEILFTAAKKYLDMHLNGRTDVPLKKWKSEYTRLTSERGRFYQEYSRLKEEVRDLEIIKRTAEKLMSTPAPEHDNSYSRQEII